MSEFSHDFTVGIEEELLLVDVDTGRLSPTSSEVLERVSVGRDVIDHELYAAQLELRSGRCGSVTEAVGALRAARAEVRSAGGELLGSGVHPTARLGDALLIDEPRYAKVGELFGGLVRRTPEAALHVHIGLPSEEAAIRAFNGLREWQPLLTALAANSPYCSGADSGLESARFALVQAYPTRGASPAFETYAEYAASVARVVAAIGVPDGSYLYWDVRLRPTFGTVEIREMDAQTSVASVGAIASLARAMVAAFAEGRLPVHGASVDEVGWASFLAARHGVHASLPFGRRRVGVGELLDQVLDVVSAADRFPEDASLLAGLADLVAAEGGAGAQRSIAEAAGLDALVPHLIAATATG